MEAWRVFGFCFLFFFLLLCSENSTHPKTYQIVSVCSIYSFLSSPNRDLSWPGGLCLKLQSFLSDLVLVLSSICLMSNIFAATKITLPPLACYRAAALKINVSLAAMKACTRCKLQSLARDYPFKALLQAEDASATKSTCLLLQQAVVELGLT